MSTTAEIQENGPASQRRKEPSQQRSRERVERMMVAAKAIIEEQGSDALRMGEVAERAGVSIGSLYQFFPDKSAIIRALAERITESSRACIDAALNVVTTEEELRKAFSELVDIYYGLFKAEPVMRDIWSGMQADKGLRALELADSRMSTETLINALERVTPSADPEDMATRAFLVWQLGESAMRLAISVERDEGDRLVEAYKRMALRELLDA
jgi:AcrR family transcriptional regulator